MEEDNLIHLDQLDGTYEKKRRKLERKSIKTKFGGCCMWCGEAFDELNGRPFTIEHILPESRYGHLKHYWANLGAACSPCNNSKSDQNWITWYRKQTFYDPDKEADILATLIEWNIA